MNDMEWEPCGKPDCKGCALLAAIQAIKDDGVGPDAALPAVIHAAASVYGLDVGAIVLEGDPDAIESTKEVIH